MRYEEGENNRSESRRFSLYADLLEKVFDLAQKELMEATGSPESDFKRNSYGGYPDMGHYCENWPEYVWGTIAGVEVYRPNIGPDLDPEDIFVDNERIYQGGIDIDTDSEEIILYLGTMVTKEESCTFPRIQEDGSVRKETKDLVVPVWRYAEWKTLHFGDVEPETDAPEQA